MNQILKASKQIQETIDSSGFSDLKTYLESIQGSPIKKWDDKKSYLKDELVIYNDLFYQSINANSTIGTFILSEWKIIGGSGSGISDLNSFTTNDLAESATKKYVTSTEKSVLSNTSGTNTGDETTLSIKTKLGQASTSTDGYVSSTDWNNFNNKTKVNDISTSSTTETYSIDKIKDLISNIKGFEVVSSLPSSNISSDKLYILSTQNYSMNYYDGSAWHTLSGGSSSITYTDFVI